MLRWLEGQTPMDMQNSLLALDAQAFLGALDELGIEGEQRNFLLREKRKYDSALGGLMDFGATPEGQKRATILPMVSPEGMTGWYAITSGQAQLALPSIITGLVEGAAKAIDLPRAALAGQIPRADDINEALNLAGMVQLGGAASAGAGLFDYDPNTTRVFAGPRAATADLKALERAKRLAATKTDPDTIWNQTGWFKLGDNKWRFEIPDNDVALRRPEDAAQIAVEMRQQAKDIRAGIKNRNADLQSQPDLFPALLRKENGILARKATQLDQEASGNYGPEWSTDTLGQRAKYAITDSELQRAYPNLMRDTIVRTNQNLDGSYGEYNEGRKALGLASDAFLSNSKNPDVRDQRGVLIHELQHAIQGEEDFARGTSTSAAYELLLSTRDEGLKNLAAQRAELLAKADPELGDLLSKRFYDYLSDAQMRQLDAQISSMPYGKQLLDTQQQYVDLVTKPVTEVEAYDAYTRHLGELEARLAQERRDFTLAQRRAIPPFRMDTFIPDDRTIKSFKIGPTKPSETIQSITPDGLLGLYVQN